MADLPERSTVLVEVNKQIVTMASAVLTLASAYATAVIGKNLELGQGVALGISGVLLVVSISSALASHALVTGYLKVISATTPNNDDIRNSWNRAACFANIGYFCFAMAFASLVFFVWLRVSDDTVNAETIVAGAADLLVKDGRIEGRDSFVSLTSTNDKYEVVFTDKKGARVLCHIDARTGAVEGCQ